MISAARVSLPAWKVLALFWLCVAQPFAAVGQSCPGDCDGDRSVRIDELITAVRVALGESPVGDCAAADDDGSGAVGIDELVRAVNSALNGCGPSDPITVRGVCRVPGQSGLTNCAMGTDVTMWRCENRPTCLDDPAGRTFIAMTEVGITGSFSFVVEGPQIRGKVINMEANVQGALLYRSLTIGPLTGGGGGGLGEEVVEVIVDPSSEGAIRAIAAAGFETFTDAEALALIESTRADSRADYGGLEAGKAADLAELIALDLLEAGLHRVSAVTVSADGQHVYAVSEGDNAISVFTRGRGGALQRVQLVRGAQGARDGLGAARDVAVSPDGLNVYVAGAGDDALAVFRRNRDGGRLSALQVVRDGEDGVRGLNVPVDVEVSPDGNHVYVASPGDSAVAVFRRDARAGTLDFVEAYFDGERNVEGIGDAAAVQMAFGGELVLVAGAADAAVVTFVRDVETGRLSLFEIEAPEVNGVRPLLGVSSLAVSADGADVYAGALEGVAHLHGEPEAGLRFITLYQPDDGRSLLFARVGFAPDSEHLYASALAGDSLSLFRRDPAKRGQLLPGGTLYDGEQGVDGLAGPIGFALAPDGTNVYVAAARDDAIGIFLRNPNTGTLGFLGVRR